MRINWNTLYVAGWLAVLVGLPSCGGCRRAGQDRAMNQHIARTQAAGRIVELIASVTPTPKDDFRQGDTVPITYRLTADTAALDSAVLVLSGQRLGRIDGTWYYETASNTPVGRIPFRITAYQGKDSTVRVGEFALKAAEAPVPYGYRVVRSYPHDKTAYTQGLFWHDGHLYESTGQNGQSSLRKVDLATGEVLQKHDLEEKYFGEGVAILGGKIYQLTWQNSRGFVYDAESFELLDEFGYGSEGWGLTTDGEYLYMSSGTEKIAVLNPATFRTVRTIEVCTEAGKVTELNELEWIDGEIWANVYQSDAVLRIDPATGVVTGIVDLRRILPPADKDLSTDVLNGIAWDSEMERLFVTGKNWKKLFEIEVVQQ